VQRLCYATPTHPRERPPPGDPSPIVFVVDDDSAVRKAIESLLGSVGLAVRSFGSAREFLAEPLTHDHACLVLDVRLPGASGLELQRELTSRECTLPIVFISAYGDIPMSVGAMKAGAVEFLSKPFREQDLLEAIELALQRAAVARRSRQEVGALRQRFASLTRRESEVLGLVIAGMLNKQIAYQLRISEVTVKIHRGHVMRKTEAGSVAELARMAERVGIPPARA
jgi:FixJ family two-component response regulator